MFSATSAAKAWADAAAPRLVPALVPAPLWGRSVYQLLRTTRRGGEWKRLRADVVARADGGCHICGGHHLHQYPPQRERRGDDGL
jgi:hypothetical protein